MQLPYDYLVLSFGACEARATCACWGQRAHAELAPALQPIRTNSSAPRRAPPQTDALSTRCASLQGELTWCCSCPRRT